MKKAMKILLIILVVIVILIVVGKRILFPPYDEIEVTGKYEIECEDCFTKVRTIGRTKLKIGIVEENTVLKKWYEGFGFEHKGTKKYGFFPFTCGYMEKEL